MEAPPGGQDEGQYFAAGTPAHEKELDDVFAGLGRQASTRIPHAVEVRDLVPHAANSIGRRSASSEDKAAPGSTKRPRTEAPGADAAPPGREDTKPAASIPSAAAATSQPRLPPPFNPVKNESAPAAAPAPSRPAPVVARQPARRTVIAFSMAGLPAFVIAGKRHGPTVCALTVLSVLLRESGMSAEDSGKYVVDSVDLVRKKQAWAKSRAARLVAGRREIRSLNEARRTASHSVLVPSRPLAESISGLAVADVLYSLHRQGADGTPFSMSRPSVGERPLRCWRRERCGGGADFARLQALRVMRGAAKRFKRAWKSDAALLVAWAMLARRANRTGASELDASRRDHAWRLVLRAAEARERAMSGPCIAPRPTRRPRIQPPEDRNRAVHVVLPRGAVAAASRALEDDLGAGAGRAVAGALTFDLETHVVSPHGLVLWRAPRDLARRYSGGVSSASLFEAAQLWTDGSVTPLAGTADSEGGWQAHVEIDRSEPGDALDSLLRVYWRYAARRARSTGRLTPVMTHEALRGLVRTGVRGLDRPRERDLDASTRSQAARRSSIQALARGYASTTPLEGTWFVVRQPVAVGALRDATISASRCVEAPSRHRRDSCPSHDDVGGFFFDFEAVRTASSDRDAPRRPRRRRRFPSRGPPYQRRCPTTGPTTRSTRFTRSEAPARGRCALRCARSRTTRPRPRRPLCTATR